MTTALFLLDAALDAAVLLLAARMAGKRIRARRLLAGALLGAALAKGARLAALSRMQTAALWLPCAAALSFAAFGRGRMLRHALLTLCAAGLLGGTLTALAGATGSLFLAYTLGFFCIAAMTAALARAGRAARDVRRASVVCVYRGRTAQFEAMIDSGNTLRDYLTHAPVIVVEEEAGRRLLALEERALRPIFADTAGGRQMMALLTPEKTVIVSRGSRREVRAAVALSSGLQKGAPALVPASLLDE